MLKSSVDASEWKRVKRTTTRLLFNKKSMGLVALKAVEIIKTSTLSGVDASGSSFAPYSKGYIKRKSKRQGIHYTGKVNLDDKGHMQSAIQTKSKRALAVIYFNKSKEAVKAKAHHQGGGNLPKREWFDVRGKNIGRLRGVIAKYLQKAFRVYR